MTTQNFNGGAPMVGAEVFTVDGDKLGTVKETSGACFKVDVKMRPDYWLGSDCIASAAGNTVRLSLPKDRLDDAKVDGPDHGGVHRHDDTTIV